MNIITIIAIGLLGILLGAVFSPISILLAKKIKTIDDPGSSPRKIHTKATPCAGGLVLFLGLLTAVVSGLIKDAYVIKILFAGLFVFLTGLVDDRKSLSVLAKFFGQFMAATVLIVLGIRVQVLHNLFEGVQSLRWLVKFGDIFITYLWVIGLTNAFNFVDSMDGLLMQLSQISLLIIVVATILFGQFELVIFAIFMKGLLLSMSVFNSHEALYFLGDSGSMCLGFTLAAASILLRPLGLPQANSWFFPITLFAVPLFDMLLVINSRSRKRNKVYKASRDHTYHRLCSIFRSPYRAIEVMKLETYFWGLAGLYAIYQSTLMANLLFGAFLVNYLISLVYLESSNVQKALNDAHNFYNVYK